MVYSNAREGEVFKIEIQAGGGEKPPKNVGNYGRAEFTGPIYTLKSNAVTRLR